MKTGDTGNFTPCCSVTQSQEVMAQGATAGEKTITRTPPGGWSSPEWARMMIAAACSTAGLIYSELLTANYDTLWLIITRQNVTVPVRVLPLIEKNTFQA